MSAIAHYMPGHTVRDVLAIAGESLDADRAFLFADLLVKLIARDLATDELAAELTAHVVAGREAHFAARYFRRKELIRYYEKAPETEALVMRLLQSARTEWMRDPS